MGTKFWTAGVSMGLLIGTMAACTPPTPAPEVETPTNDSGVASLADRSAYSEVPLPEDDLLVGADPEEIALSAFGSPDPGEGNFEQEAVLVKQTATQALVSLTETGLLDDSVEGMRYRLEFVPEDDQWRLDWAGRQVRCWPNRGSQEWSTELCN